MDWRSLINTAVHVSLRPVAAPRGQFWRDAVAVLWATREICGDERWWRNGPPSAECLRALRRDFHPGWDPTVDPAVLGIVRKVLGDEEYPHE